MRPVQSYVFTLVFLICLQGFSQTFSTNKIDTAIIGGTDYSCSYFIPEGCAQGADCPLIVFLDPVGRGAFPVRIYSDFAERNKVILVGSNDSKNGPIHEALLAGRSMVYFALENFNVNRQAVFVSGFSGGSRAAMALSMIVPEINGIIANGGGLPFLPEYHLTKERSIPYAAVAGIEDFNYSEHFTLETNLNETDIPNIRLVGGHGHAWTDESTFEIAYYWLLAKNGLELPDRYISSSVQFLKFTQDSISRYDAVRLKIQLERDLRAELPAFKVNESELPKLRKDLVKLLKYEDRYRSRLRDSLALAFVYASKEVQNTPTIWLKSELGILKKRHESFEMKNKLAKSRMYKRLITSVGASAYEHAMSFQYSNMEAAIVGIDIWSASHGNQMWEYWMKAKFYALQNDIETSLEYLDLLIANDYQNGQSLLQEPAFQILKDSDQFRRLTSQ